jgi:hypothetical protein
MSNQIASVECCPKFEPALWDDKLFEWEHKRFVKDHVFTLFFIPITFGRVIKRVMSKIDKAGAKAEDWMGLADHTSRWNMDLYIAVDKEVPGADNVTLTGKFISKVYEGPFKNTRQWCDDFKSFVKGKGLEVKKWYMWYTTCPKCAKKYGKNYVVIVGQVG